jgi:hypothetical protein
MLVHLAYVSASGTQGSACQHLHAGCGRTVASEREAPHVFVSGKVSAVVVEVARAEMMRPPRARDFDHKGTVFTRDNDMLVHLVQRG